MSVLFQASYLEVAEWVDSAWSKIASDMIVKSIKCTGILRDDWSKPLDPSTTHARLAAILNNPQESVDMASSEEDGEDIIDAGLSNIATS